MAGLGGGHSKGVRPPKGGFMSLLNRKLPPLGRVARQERDDRIVVVATEKC